MKKGEQHTELGSEILEGLASFRRALESGEVISERLTVRSVRLDLHPRTYHADEVKRVRQTLNASQPLLASFLGVSVTTVRAWERGTRQPSPMACRFLDEIVDNPDLWSRRLLHATSG
jgi:putative transcriptional regulator